MCNIYCMLTDNVSEEGEEEQQVLCHPHQREIVCDLFFLLGKKKTDKKQMNGGI